MNSQKIWSGDGGWWGKIFSRNLAMSYKKPWRFPPWKILIFWSQVTYPTPGSRWRKKGQDFVVPKRLHPGSDVTVLVNKRVCWLINVCVCVCVCVFSRWMLEVQLKTGAVLLLLLLLLLLMIRFGSCCQIRNWINMKQTSFQARVMVRKLNPPKLWKLKISKARLQPTSKTLPWEMLDNFETYYIIYIYTVVHLSNTCSWTPARK